jgi:hypothetical protein
MDLLISAQSGRSAGYVRLTLISRSLPLDKNAPAYLAEKSERSFALTLTLRNRTILRTG